MRGWPGGIGELRRAWTVRVKASTDGMTPAGFCQRPAASEVTPGRDGHVGSPRDKDHRELVRIANDLPRIEHGISASETVPGRRTPPLVELG